MRKEHMISKSYFRRFYPDDSLSGTIRFYDWVREHIDPEMRVLNLGAGPATNDSIRTLKGEVAEVVGADPDPIVDTNTELDSSVVLTDQRLPFADSSFDLVISDFVLEHVTEPLAFVTEVRRVLKTRASFFFRTPNVFHYVPMISRATPHWFHLMIANRVRGLAADAHEPWPTFYRMNSRRRLERFARTAGFRDIELRMVEAEPSYLSFHPTAFLLGVAYERLVNSSDRLSGFRVNIQGRLTK